MFDRAHGAFFLSAALRKGNLSYLLNFSTLIRNGMTMGISSRISEKFIELFNQQRRLDVLQLFRYLMHFIPVKLKFLYQESLPEAVLANDHQRLGFAVFGDFYAVVLLIGDQVFE